MKLRATQDNVIVRFDDVETTFRDTKLIRPDIAKNKPTWGIAIDVGPGYTGKKGRFIPTTIQVGDRVMVPWGCGTEFFGNGGHHTIVREYAEHRKDTDPEILATEV